MTTSLLDANALIALTVSDHEHHERVARWFAGGPEVAVSPMVEGAFLRFIVRLGEPVTTGQDVLHHLHEHRSCRRWGDDVSYADIDLGAVRGHRQISDAYLVGLAAAHAGVVATLDEAMAHTWPDRVLRIPG